MPLRERKFAETKIRILNVFLKKLKQKDLDEISVVEICESADISYKTFFNYFEKKSDLLAYYLQFWSIEGQYILSTFENCSFEERVNKKFQMVAENYSENYKIVKEIVAFLALNWNNIKIAKLTPAEYIVKFPKYKGVENYQFKPIDWMLVSYLEEAKKSGEFSNSLDNSVVFSMIRSIFFWVILSVNDGNSKTIENLYREQLNMVWKATKNRA